MKKLLFAILLVLVSVTFAGAFNYAGEDQAQANSASADDMNSVVDQFAKTLKGVQDRQAGTSKAVKALGDDMKIVKQEQTATKEAVTKLATGMTEVAKEMGKNYDLTKEVGNNLGGQIKSSFWVLGVVLVIAMIMIVAWYRAHVAEAIKPIAASTNRFVNRADEITDAVVSTTETVNNRADEVLEEVRSGFEQMRTSFNDLPAKVANAVQTLDASPFEFEAAGHRVTYQSPIDGIAEGYYLLLHVPKDESGTPATYVRSHEVSRGVARRNCRKTMQKYFKGAFKGPEYDLQRELIGYLITTGDLTYSKIT